MGLLDNLTEGFVASVGSMVRDAFAGDKDLKSLERGVQSRGLSNIGPGWTMFDGNGYQGLSEHLFIDRGLNTRLQEYEEMDDYPELATALNLYADEVAQEDAVRNRTVWFTCDDEDIKEIGNQLLHETLRIDEEIWGIARSLSKNGNLFGELLVNEDGVRGINFLPAITMRRYEDYDHSLIGFSQSLQGKGLTVDEFKAQFGSDGRLKKPTQSNAIGFGQTPAASEAVAFEPWEVVHWRLRDGDLQSMYGTSVLEPARWIWRRLVLLEDAALLYKLTRAPAKLAFYVDVGDLNNTQAQAYVNEVKRRHRRQSYVDRNGKMDFRVNPSATDEDYWIPTRGGRDSTRIDLVGGQDWQAMDDIRYFRQKLLAAITVPASYLGMAEGAEDAQAAIAGRDVRFAKKVLRIQREVKNGLRKVMKVHFSALGIDLTGIKWDIDMSSPSSIFELAQIEVMNAKADLAQRMEPYASRRWAMRHIMDFSEDEIEEMLSQQRKDVEQNAVHAAEVQMKASKVMGIGPGGGEDEDEEEDGDGEGPGPAKPKLPPPPGIPGAGKPKTSKEAGTGNKSPSPGKGKPKTIGSVAEVRDRLSALKDRNPKADRVRIRKTGDLND